MRSKRPLPLWLIEVGLSSLHPSFLKFADFRVAGALVNPYQLLLLFPQFFFTLDFMGSRWNNAVLLWRFYLPGV